VEQVLVWNKNRRVARVHVGEACPTLTRSDIPHRTVRFSGPGTAGWLSRVEAERLSGAAKCHRCM
jgi:hypothetical protein